MAVHESGDWERRAIGPLLGSGEGILKQKAAGGFFQAKKRGGKKSISWFIITSVHSGLQASDVQTP